MYFLLLLFILRIEIQETWVILRLPTPQGLLGLKRVKVWKFQEYVALYFFWIKFISLFVIGMKWFWRRCFYNFNLLSFISLSFFEGLVPVMVVGAVVLPRLDNEIFFFPHLVPSLHIVLASFSLAKLVHMTFKIILSPIEFHDCLNVLLVQPSLFDLFSISNGMLHLGPCFQWRNF